MEIFFLKVIVFIVVNTGTHRMLRSEEERLEIIYCHLFIRKIRKSWYREVRIKTRYKLTAGPALKCKEA